VGVAKVAKSENAAGNHASALGGFRTGQGLAQPAVDVLSKFTYEVEAVAVPIQLESSSHWKISIVIGGVIQRNRHNDCGTRHNQICIQINGADDRRIREANGSEAHCCGNST